MTTHEYQPKCASLQARLRKLIQMRSDEKREKDRRQFKSEVRKFLNAVTPNYRFEVEVIVEVVLGESVKCLVHPVHDQGGKVMMIYQNTSIYEDLMGLSKAFYILHTYAANIWKSTHAGVLHEIKTCSGGWKYYTERYVVGVDRILGALGYQYNNEKRAYIFDVSLHDATRADGISFTCYLASLECEVLHDILSRVISQSNGDLGSRQLLGQVYECRLRYKSCEECVESLKTSFSHEPTSNVSLRVGEMSTVSITRKLNECEENMMEDEGESGKDVTFSLDGGEVDGLVGGDEGSLGGGGSGGGSIVGGDEGSSVCGDSSGGASGGSERGGGSEVSRLYPELVVKLPEQHGSMCEASEKDNYNNNNGWSKSGDKHSQLEDKEKGERNREIGRDFVMANGVSNYVEVSTGGRKMRSNQKNKSNKTTNFLSCIGGGGGKSSGDESRLPYSRMEREGVKGGEDLERDRRKSGERQVRMENGDYRGKTTYSDAVKSSQVSMYEVGEEVNKINEGIRRDKKGLEMRSGADVSGYKIREDKDHVIVDKVDDDEEIPDVNNVDKHVVKRQRELLAEFEKNKKNVENEENEKKKREKEWNTWERERKKGEVEETKARREEQCNKEKREIENEVIDRKGRGDLAERKNEMGRHGENVRTMQEEHQTRAVMKIRDEKKKKEEDKEKKWREEEKQRIEEEKRREGEYNKVKRSIEKRREKEETERREKEEIERKRREKEIDRERREKEIDRKRREKEEIERKRREKEERKRREEEVERKRGEDDSIKKMAAYQHSYKGGVKINEGNVDIRKDMKTKYNQRDSSSYMYEDTGYSVPAALLPLFMSNHASSAPPGLQHPSLQQYPDHTACQYRDCPPSQDPHHTQSQYPHHTQSQYPHHTQSQYPHHTQSQYPHPTQSQYPHHTQSQYPHHTQSQYPHPTQSQYPLHASQQYYGYPPSSGILHPSSQNHDTPHSCNSSCASYYSSPSLYDLHVREYDPSRYSSSAGITLSHSPPACHHTSSSSSYDSTYSSSSHQPTSPSIQPPYSSSSSHLPTTSTSHLPTSTSHLPTSTSHLPTSSSHLPTSTFHLPTSSSYLPTSSHLPTTSSSHLPTSTSHLPTSSSHLPTSSSHLPTSSSYLPTLSSYLPTSSSHLPTSSSHLPTSSHRSFKSSSPYSKPGALHYKDEIKGSGAVAMQVTESDVAPTARFDEDDDDMDVGDGHTSSSQVQTSFNHWR